MSTETQNPYAASLNDVAEQTGQAGSSHAEPWKAIAWRWERLRLFYNLAVGVSGIPALWVGFVSGPSMALEVIAGALLYALGANVCYLLGPITEMYLNWLADKGERRFLPTLIVHLIRGKFLTAFMFIGGTVGSMLLTLLLALGFAFSLAFKDF